MTLKNKLRIGLVSFGLVALPSLASANEGFYGSLGAGIGFPGGTSNSGELTDDFVTGAGTTIPAGTMLPAGTDLSWDTDLKTGFTINGTIGYAWANGLRLEVEAAYRDNNVKSHDGVSVGGTVIDDEDAGVLITGSDNLGITVGELVSDGQGEIAAWSFMANVFYDFDMGNSMFVPYIGGGIGYADVKSRYNPSAVEIIRDKSGSFAFQLMAGFAVPVGDTTELFFGYRYFQADKPKLDVGLLPATLESEYKTHSLEAGLRVYFN